MARENRKQQREVLYSRKDKNKKNENPDDSDSDDNEEDIGKYLQPTQSKLERLQIRKSYRGLLDNLSKNKHDLINPESDKLNQALEEANELSKKVRLPREGALDSATFRAITNINRQRADALNTDFHKFEPSEFAEKLIRFFRGPTSHDEGDVRISSQGWITLGAAVQKFFCRSPAFHFMCGSFERGERPAKIKITKVKPNEKENQGKATVPSELKDIEKVGADENEATTEEVERVLSILQQCYVENDENPICYFEFVLNPDSFGQTVENIFYSSFLVRDGHARISLDEDGLPIIEPIIDAEGEQPQENRKRHQTVVSITPTEWKELVEVYEISEPLIPTRESLSVSRHVMNESTSSISAIQNSAASSSKKRKTKS